MRIVAALCGATPDGREIAPIAALSDDHDLIVIPDSADPPGSAGCRLVRALGGALPGREVVAVLTQWVVDPDDPAFGSPTGFVGPVLDAHAAATAVLSRHWQVRLDGTKWRRVVPALTPREIVELPAIRHLIDSGVVVVAVNGCEPVVRAADGTLRDVAAVVDGDQAAAAMALALKADLLLFLTPAAPVGAGAAMAQAAAHRFVRGGGGRAAIGDLSVTAALVAGTAGIQITDGGAR